jgi:DUF1365 family protein
VSISALYEGTVRHRRFAVRGHELRHRLVLAYIDLDELPTLLGGRLLRQRAGLVRFRRSDYLGAPSAPSTPSLASTASLTSTPFLASTSFLASTPALTSTPALASTTALADAVRATVAAQTGMSPRGPIRVLTQLRSYGHCFNPISFYYCMDPAGETVQSVVAEVTSTPWGERHAYVLAPAPDAGGSAHSPDARPAPSKVLRGGGLRKALHVSPFMGMDHTYEWALTAPRETLSVHIASHRDGRLAFDATLALRRRELRLGSLARATARYPFATLRVLALIYAHGLALKLKGVPLHPHPRPGVA